MPARPEGFVSQWLAALGTAALLALAGVFLLGAGRRTSPGLVRASYDSLFRLAPAPIPETRETPVVLVYLDRESYQRERQNPDAPWDRRLHAALVRRLTAAGARAIVFDIVFAGPGPDPAADRELADAIQANGRVILAAELNDWQRQTAQTVDLAAVSPVLPFAPLNAAAAGWGLASLRVDDDFTVRRYFAGHTGNHQPSLTWAAARILQLPDTLAGPDDARWLRYQGPPLALPHVSFSAALRTDEVPDAFFRDRIVLIGARPIVGAFTDRRDEYHSPWPEPGRGTAYLPAVEVHATQMLNLVRGDSLHRLPAWAELLIIVAAALGFPALLFAFRPLPAAGVAFAAEALVLGAVVLALGHGGIWFPWLIIGAVQIPGALAGAVLFRSAEWYRQRRRLETARRVAEAKIREQAALLDKAQDAILVRELTGQVTYLNPAAERLFGWSTAEWMAGAAAEAVFAPAAKQLADAETACAARGEWLGELELATRDGGRRIVQSRWTIIRDDAGQPASRLLINTDITEKKRIEAQFLRAQRMETIGTLAGGMAHDLNSALAPVLMGIQLIRRDTTDPETRRMLSVMEDNTNRGADMVRQVLLFSRGVADERAVLNLGRLLRQVEEIVRHSFPLRISVSLLAPPDLWPVSGNATQLNQALLNLCLNARDAMPGHGELSLSADNVELGDAEAGTLPHGRPGEFVMLLIADTGEGIAPENLPRLFEPFFTTKPAGQGTGLGLATVARIVAAHGGFVNVRSERGVGTMFEIYLPKAASAASTPPGPDTAESDLPRGNGELVLIMDNDRAVKELLTQALNDHGYQALAAGSSAEGLALVRSHADPLFAVLLDATLADQAGDETAAQIHAIAPQAAIVTMVGAAQHSAASAADPAALIKPFPLPELFRRLRAALTRREN